MPPDTARQQDAALGRIETRQAKEDQARRSYEADKAKSNGIVQQIAAKGDKPEAAAQINALTGGKASAGGGDAARGPVGGLSPHKKSADGDLTAADAAKFGKQLASEAKKPNKSEELAGANDAPAIATDGGRGASDGGGDAPSPEAAGEGAGGEGSLGAASQVTEAPPSVFAGEIGTAGKEIAEAGKLELAATSEALPEFTAVMSGEDKQPGAASIAKVSADANIPQGGEGPDATAPDLRMEPKLKGRKGKPGADLKGAQAETPPEVLRELFAASLSRIDTDSTSNTSPGPAPTVQLSGSSSPTRASDEAGEAIARSDDAFVSNIAAIDAGPGPEQVQPQALQETIDPATFEMPAIPEVPADPAMLAYMSKGHEKAVYDQADADQGPVFDASMAAAQKEFETAVTLRDESHEQEVATATEAIATQNEQAAADQSAAVTAARAEIDKGRSDTKDKQEEELKKAKKAGDRERRATEQTIDARRQDDDKKIQTQYKEAEKKADAEKDKAESKAAAEKSKAEEKQGDESWWDSAASAVGSFLDSVASAVTAIFDTLSAAVGSILNAVKDAAMSVIDAAISFATSALDTLGGVLKGLVNSLLADIFPSLAAALNGLIDSAVNMAKEGITAIGEQLKAGVAAAVDTLNAGIQAVVAAYKVAVTTALAIASAAVSGDWEGALKAMLGGALSLAGIDQGAFYGLVGQGMDTINAIVDDPGTFVGNMVDAVGQGFSQFAGNFPTHLMTGAISWLTGSLGEAGLKLPDTWDAGGIFTLVLDVMGLSYDKIRGKVADRVGEENVAMLESAWGYVQAAIDGGLEGLWEHAKGQLGNLWQGVLDAALGFLMEKVVTAAVTKIASMFSPVGAIVQALITVWNVYKFVQEQASRIMGLVTAVVDGMSQIVAGQLGPAANMIEGSLAGLVPVAISLLANLLGLGGVSAKVKEIIEALQGQVGGAVDFVLDKLVDLGKSAFEAVSGAMGGGKKEEPAAAANAEPAAAQVDPAAAVVAFPAETTFTDAHGHAHRLWTEAGEGAPRLMVASTPIRVVDQIDAWRPILKAMGPPDSATAGKLIGKAIAIERAGDALAVKIAAGTAEPAALTAKQLELAPVLQDIFSITSKNGDFAGIDPRDTLATPSFATFSQRFIDLGTQVGLPNTAAEAERIWLLAVTTIQRTDDSFSKIKKLTPEAYRVELSSDTMKDIIGEFDPLMAALKPSMDAWVLKNGGKKWAFWSGKPAAAVACNAPGWNALESSALGGLFDKLDINGKWNTQMWGGLSNSYAEYLAKAVGTAAGFGGFVGMDSTGVESIYKSIESKAVVNVLGKTEAAKIDFDWYACISIAGDPEKPDATKSVDGIPGTFFKTKDRNAAVKQAEDANRTLHGKGAQPHETLLKHLQANSDASPGFDPNLMAELDKSTAPDDPSRRLPTLMPFLFHQRPTLESLFVLNSNVGKSLSGDLASITATVRTEGLDETRNFAKDSPYLEPLKTAVQGPLAPTVREPTIAQSVLQRPSPTVPGSAKSAITSWLEKEPSRGEPVAARTTTALPHHSYTNAAGEKHELFVDPASKTVKQASDNPQDVTKTQKGKAFQLAGKIEELTAKYLAGEDTLEEIKTLLAQLKVEMAAARGEVDEAVLVKKRLAFEQKLGMHAFGHAASNGAAKDLADKSWRLLEGLGKAALAKAGAVDAQLLQDPDLNKFPEFRKMVQSCGMDLGAGFFGSVGKSYDRIKQVFSSGNLREKVQHVVNFSDLWATQAFKPDTDAAGLLKDAGVAEAEVRVVMATIEAERAKPEGKRSLDKKGLYGSVEGNEEYAKAKDSHMDRKFPTVPLEALSREELFALARRFDMKPREETKTESVLAELKKLQVEEAKKNKRVTAGTSGGGEGNPMTLSDQGREKDIGLSGREEAAHGKSDAKMPFLEGMLANMVDSENAWIKEAVALEMPIRAGVSGTTHRWMNFAAQLGADKAGSRLAMLGHLIPTNAHSFHEIMVAAQGHVPYTAGSYFPCDPLGKGELTSLAKDSGALPEEVDALLGITPKA